MLNRIISIVKKAPLPTILFLITLYICYKNYTPGTFLTGWDTIHPEFNYGIYLKRIISGAWQSHQGLGSVASQAHASEIPRVIILLFLDIFFPINFIRYLYVFLMLIIGPLGVYFFIKEVVLKNSDEVTSSIGGFGGGLFYLLNLCTLQHFVVPLEMFLTHYGFLGWSFMYLTKFYDSGDRKNLLKFFIVSLLISPQAHTPTLFYVYLMFIFIYLSFVTLSEFLSKKGRNIYTLVTRVFIIISLTLVANFYWLLPNIYYGVVKGNEVSLSKIHHLFSEEAFLVNKKFGNIKDTSILKNFLFDWGIYSGDNSYSDLLGPWNMHLKKPFALFLTDFIPLFMVVGIIFSFIKKNRYALTWLVMSFIGIFFILNVNPPFGFIFEYFQNQIPLFKELFRFPFTKFSIILILSYSVFFGYFTSYFSQLFKKKKFSYILNFIFVVTFSYGLINFSLPAFKGYLIHPAMRENIPDRYFQMFEYFDSQNEYGRVVSLPIHSFWGWVTHSWNQKGTGYQGAGFLWFGIKQPLLDREFDRWNIANEQPYRELSTAIYSEDPGLLITTLEKYKIRWLILDESVLAPGMDVKVLFYPQIKELISNISELTLVKDFGEGLSVYRYSPQKNFTKTEVINSYQSVENSLFKEYSDPAYLEYGDYISGYNIRYQFLGFNSVYENIDNNLVFSDENAVYFKLSESINGINTIDKIPVSLYIKNREFGKVIEFLFDNHYLGEIHIPGGEDRYIIRIGEDIFDISMVGSDGYLGNIIISTKNEVKINTYRIGENRLIDNIFYSNIENCDPLEMGKNSSFSLLRLDSGFEVIAKDTIACVTIPLSSVSSDEFSDLIILGFESGSLINSNDFCMLDNISGLCVDKYIGNGYFVSNIFDTSKRYDIRFFSDARNMKNEIKKDYRNVGLYNTQLVSSEILNINIDESLNINDYLVFKKNPQFTLEPEQLFGNRRTCKTGGRVEESNFTDSGNGLVFNSTEISLCDSYSFPLAKHSTGYVLEVKANYQEGVPLRIFLTNEYSKRSDLEVSLPAESSDSSYFYAIPPMGKGTGYTINISNYVFGDTLSKNELQYISLIPVSYELIKNVKSIGLEIENLKGSIYVLNEAYDTGWVAMCGIKKCDAEHVKVNNWANGWSFNGNNGKIPSNVKIIFWPQIMEYVGLLLLGITFYFTWRYKDFEILD